MGLGGGANWSLTATNSSGRSGMSLIVMVGGARWP